MSTPQPTELDFDILEENWTRYKLTPDNTILRVKITLTKIFQLGFGDLGYPNLKIGATNLLTAIVPDSLKREPSADPNIVADDIKNGVELAFERIGTETWQRYDLKNGYVLKIRPVVGKVIRTTKYDNEKEPIYWANIQSTMDVGKKTV